MTRDEPDPREMCVRIHRDHLYIDAVTYDRNLADAPAVALLRDEDDLLILPVTGAGSGGFYIKQVNARGDRAIHAADFFRLNGISDTQEHHVLAAWTKTIAGFTARAFFAGVPPLSKTRK